MSHNTLSQNTVFAFSGRSRNVEKVRHKHSASYVMGLMLALIFVPMFAIHMGMRIMSHTPVAMESANTSISLTNTAE